MMKKSILSLVLLAALVWAMALPAAAAQVTASVAPSGMVLAGQTLYAADSYHRAIWAIQGGRATLLTGRVDVTDLSGRPVAGYRDASLSKAAFGEPWDLVAYLDGFLVSDRSNHVIRYVDVEKGRVSTALGSGRLGSRNGQGTEASFSSPSGLAVDEKGTVYIADTGNHRIRAMSPDGKVKTYAGKEEGCALGSVDQARFCEPTGLCYADGVLYVADSGNHRIVAIADGQVTPVAGAQLTGDAAWEGDYLNGPCDTARFSNPQGVAVSGDTVYVADTGNGAVRAIRDGYVTTLIKTGAGATYPVSPRGLLARGDSLYVGDAFSRVLLQLEAGVTQPVFADVPQEAYYAPAVRFAAANGYFAGTDTDRFSPNAPMTRGMALTVLARYDGVDTGTGAGWYEAGLQWGKETGVSDGSAPLAPVTREQLVTMLYRLAGQPAVPNLALLFGDAHLVSDYADSGARWAVNAGILRGREGGLLDPQGVITRAETAAMLLRFVEHVR